MISRKKSIRQKSEIINQYFKNTYDRTPNLEKNKEIYKSEKKRKKSKINRKNKYSKKSKKNKNPKK